MCLDIFFVSSETYGAVGGDLGTRVLTSLLYHHPNSVIAAHYTMLSGAPPASVVSSVLSYLPFGYGEAMKRWWDHRGLSEKEKSAVRKQEAFVEQGGGYKALQQSRPATIGASLYDNRECLESCPWSKEEPPSQCDRSDTRAARSFISEIQRSASSRTSRTSTTSAPMRSITLISEIPNTY